MHVQDLDYQLFQMINQLGLTMSFLNPLMRFFASYAECVFYLGVIVYWFTRREVNRKMVAEALLSACIGLMISGLLGHFFYRDRPFVVHSVLQLIAHPANSSFPSDHAIGAFVIATAFWVYRRKDGVVWLALAACIAFSRVWTGVHYPTDVLAGGIIGIVSALCVHQLFIRSTIAQKTLMILIDVYEKLENKVWPKPQVKTDQFSTRR
ncbi:undecaprenyl-diphosphatase [Paenibacillus sp. N3.4]|uniref:undecaprenyl-diphosphatase n=1 Tax=Paenibacillus sp. N3.4 TaxID=2603222 RepID=UPI0011C7B76C|nr:undecaprenyl-diphosphatase [Paenibacillus sp. N3.4]TXK76963.1 undecaprenyl-diphosphatase [Paenibacillus sp. N3.4]